MAGWGPPPPLMLPKLGNGYNLENGDGGLMPIQYPSEEETCLFPILNEFDPSNINDSPNVPISPDRDDFSPQRQPQQSQLMPPILQSQQQMVQIQALTQQNVPQFQPQQSQGPQQSYQQPSLKPLSQVPPHMESGIPGSAQSASLPAARAPPPALSPATRLPPPSPTVMGNAEPSRDLSSVQVAFRQQSNKPVELRLLGVPQKSRVETQIRLCVQLVASGGQVGSGGLRWKYLYLPPDMCNNDLRSVNAHAPPSVSPVKGHDLSATLNVQTKVLCASDNREVLMCMGCVQRERRSLERKKHNVAPTPSQPNSRPATPSCNSAGISTGGIGWSEMIEQEQRKIVQFHSNPLIDFTSGEAIISLRITCYCRHHNEKVGFRIQLTL
ncbi:Protein MGA2 [Pelomyxa schiedti]|nr:Protein MGA2 [Pelomyxa schiedti]